MTSNQVKSRLLQYYLWEQGCILAATEVSCIGNADFVVINKKRVLIEVEIKVNRSDLLKELKIIEETKKGNLYCKTSICKGHKHKSYLKKYPVVCNNTIPHKFYFAVPSKLVEVAIPYLKDTPYGLICLEDIKSEHSLKEYKLTMMFKIKAKYIHKEAIKPDLIGMIAKRVCNENLSLRLKLEELYVTKHNR